MAVDRSVPDGDGAVAPRLRLATPADAPAIAALMRASVLELFPAFYDERQTASAAVHIAHLDDQLITDGTFFVHTVDPPPGVGSDDHPAGIVACGGWSRRAKLYTGSGTAEDDDRLLDPATEPARVRAMFVHRAWTRRGLGRAILRASEQAAAAEGFRALVLMATMPGVPLYAAYGFTERRRLELATLDGVRLGAVLMDRRIPVDALAQG